MALIFSASSRSLATLRSPFATSSQQFLSQLTLWEVENVVSPSSPDGPSEPIGRRSGWRHSPRPDQQHRPRQLSQGTSCGMRRNAGVSRSVIFNLRFQNSPRISCGHHSKLTFTIFHNGAKRLKKGLSLLIF
jgi:hypothetical protein